jgi:tRNA-specific 2-thiouridylase
MKKNILVAMSGGIDSAVTASLLKQSGYDVIGCILKMHQYTENAIKDAKVIANAIKIDLIVEDITKQFAIVKENFYQEYLNGRTPNPCVLCNKKVKFKTLLEIAYKNNISNIATGHYASVKFNDNLNKYIISKAKSVEKDQTYMLWRLSQDELSRLKFPIGDTFASKTDVRLFAEKNAIPFFNKDDSQDICFIPDGDYRKFIDDFSQNENNIKEGDVIIDGKIIGTHKGTPYYTIGQRRGLGIAYKEPIYVKRIDTENNIIEVATLKNTYSNGLISDDFNIIVYDNLPEKEYNVKIRYKDIGKLATAKVEANKLVVNFTEPRSSVALGQSVVLYEKDVLVGGGIISKVF